ncbi:OstA-like protein [Sphingobacterium sp. JB170]|uniref:OstA-like protein n=1 Tax=Sphingobacterium sp. JB170 TaxID=1434842 RepID=UPI00097F38E5|nr:OstA-like protein [Sphingobacterium sp. JB170]SJN32926.1 hypothetical protein FM107_07560 [Sphingobacterium sp. JB170]
MKRYILSVLSICCIFFAYAQNPVGRQSGGQEDRLTLISSRNVIINSQSGRTIYYNGVFEHKGSTLSADSSYMYEDELKRQFFEAFGNVVITQPSGTLIYSDKLHYNATPQIATLVNNVRMVDEGSILTTNHLVYKMRDQIGTYTDGGRIITGTDTITSKNGYYFERSQDAYFRNKVVVRSPDVKIYTDTMRYNSTLRTTYFFGPTDIKGNAGENLYTEKGNYQTENGIAKFSLNNLYNSESKFLKGDSLYYDRASGIGKAYNNVVFVDTLDKFYAYGGYGLYDQRTESITMTDKPLIVTIVKNDSTKTDSVETDSTQNKIVKVEGAAVDTLKTVKEDPSQLAEFTADSVVATDSLLQPPLKDTAPLVDSVYMTADTLFSQMIFLKDYKALNFNLDRDGGAIEVEPEIDYGDEEDYGDFQDDSTTAISGTVDTDRTLLNDSVRLDADLPEAISDLPPDSTEKPNKKQRIKKAVSPLSPAEKDSANMINSTMEQDSIIRMKAVIPSAAQADSIINNALTAAQTTDTTSKDTSNTAYLDTARTRIVKAYYNVRMFKSDLQAVADSVYYGMADSMFRFMGKPMIWTEGSQISSDTIYLQALNQRLDNALLVGNAFMVNAVLDTLKFNQLKGRKITAFFANNSIDRMYVDGNAENLVFSTNDSTNTITEMFHDRGARIKIKMEGKKIIDYITIRKVDQRVYPFRLVTQENEVLPGFTWRPQDRPTSKEDMISRKRDSGSASVEQNADSTVNEINRPTSLNKQEPDESLEPAVKENNTQTPEINALDPVLPKEPLEASPIIEKPEKKEFETPVNQSTLPKNISEKKDR